MPSTQRFTKDVSLKHRQHTTAYQMLRHSERVSSIEELLCLGLPRELCSAMIKLTRTLSLYAWSNPMQNYRNWNKRFSTTPQSSNREWMHGGTFSTRKNTQTFEFITKVTNWLKRAYNEWYNFCRQTFLDEKIGEKGKNHKGFVKEFLKKIFTSKSTSFLRHF